MNDWGEVAILCPRHKWLTAVRDVFARYDLPCRSIAEKKLNLEVAHRSWPAALLHVLLNPYDRFELIGVLREMFAISDVDLANAHATRQLVLSSNGWATGRLGEALALLRSLRKEIPLGEGSLSRFVDHVLDVSRMAGRLEALGFSLDGLDAFRHEAMQAECDGASLRDWVRSVCEGLRRKAAGSSQTGAEIQLLTCMKAKGLEWPVVIPLGLGREIEGFTPPFPRVEHHEGRVRIHLSAVTLDSEVAALAEKARREEFQRVLYVVVTRPKSLLLLPDSSTFYKHNDANFLKLGLWKEFDHATHLQAPSALSAGNARAEIATARFHTGPDAATLRAAVENSKAVPERILPYSLAHEQRQDGDLAERFPVTEIGGIDYGQWWHKTLEVFPWNASASKRAQYCDGVLREFPAAFAERAEGEWKRWTASELHSELIDSGKFFLPETPFSYPRSSDAWMEGVIDLIVVTKSEDIWILDWKTDRILVGESEQGFRARIFGQYGPQLEAYREVLENGMKRKVTRLGLYSTELGALIA